MCAFRDASLGRGVRMTVLTSESALRDFVKSEGPFSIAVWDFDGVVADTEPAQADAYREIVAERGAQARDGFFDDLAGRSEREIWTELQRRYRFAGDISELREERIARVTPVLAERLRPNWFVKPGLAALREAGTQSVIISSGNERIIHRCLDAWGLEGLFDAVAASSGQPQEPSKRERLRGAIEGHRSIVLEDSATFLRLASELGAATLGVMHSLNEHPPDLADAFLTCGTSPPGLEATE